MGRRKRKADRSVKGPRYITDAAYRRIRASIMRQYGPAFEMLAAYDRGECELPSDEPPDSFVQAAARRTLRSVEWEP